MGAGASAAINERLQATSQDDLNTFIRSLPEARHQKVVQALQISGIGFEDLRKWTGLQIQTEGDIVVFTDNKGPQHGWPAFTVDMDVAATAGCTIPGAENRGIMLAQLLMLWEHVKTDCESHKWKDRFGQVMPPEIATLYVCCEHVVKPATYMLQCSYVELVAEAPKQQRPEWFVSHWWGEPLCLFLACLLQHARDRSSNLVNGRVTDTSWLHVVYWVCAYANNQHELGGDVTVDPAQSSFRRAIDLTRGMISVIDADSVSFDRIWCDYEVSTAVGDRQLNEKGFLYDLVTARRGEYNGGPVCAVVLAQGYLAVDCETPAHKSSREFAFPTKMLKRALAVQLEEGQTSFDADRRHILNAIIGRTGADLELEPPAKHPKFNELNEILRGRVAASALSKAGASGGELLQTCIASLRSSQLRSLSVDFSGCEAVTVEVVAQLFTALPLTLVELAITNCAQLTRLPESITGLVNLRSLVLGGHAQVEGLSLLMNLEKLEQLWVRAPCAAELDVLTQKVPNLKVHVARKTLNEATLVDSRKVSPAQAAFDAAALALSRLKKPDLVELRMMSTPPKLVELVAKAMCILYGIVPPSWQSFKQLTKNVDLSNKDSFHMDRISDEAMTSIGQYVEDPNFDPKTIRRVSLAASALCEWALAVCAYYHATFIEKPID